METAKETKYTLKQHAAFIMRGLGYLKTFPKPILLSKTLFSIVSALVPFVNLYFSALILNELAGARDQSRLINLVILTIGLNLLANLLKSLLSRWNDYCTAYEYHSILKIYSDKQLSMDFIDVQDSEVRQEYYKISQHHKGMGQGIRQLINTYDWFTMSAIQIIVSSALAFSLFLTRVPEGSPLIWLDSPLAVAAIFLVLACGILIPPRLYMWGDKELAESADHNNRNNRIFAFYIYKLMSDIGRAKDIHTYNQKHLINKGLTQHDYLGYWLPIFKKNSKATFYARIVTFTANGLIYLYIALKAYSGAFGVGSIVLYVGAIAQFSGGFSNILGNLAWLLTNNSYLEKVFNFLDIPNKMQSGSVPVEIRDDHEIEFYNVSFKYPSSDTYALKNFNFKFRAGERTAIVGQNGSGKTTMIKLLCRLYDPTDGIIQLNGVDIREYKYDEYMKVFSVVFQDFNLLPFTLGENVAAAATYDEERALEVLGKAGFDSRLEGMPNKLDTFLYKNFEGEGVEVSGGEAQKIALARALYKDSPIIVLDEPTAALDPIAEAEVYSKFNEIVSDKTAMYVSHRLSSCRFCDNIAVLHEGALVQQGSHDELVIDKNGKYYELWHAQAQYYSDEKV